MKTEEEFYAEVDQGLWCSVDNKLVKADSDQRDWIYGTPVLLKTDKTFSTHQSQAMKLVGNKFVAVDYSPSALLPKGVYLPYTGLSSIIVKTYGGRRKDFGKEGLKIIFDFLGRPYTLAWATASSTLYIPGYGVLWNSDLWFPFTEVKDFSKEFEEDFEAISRFRSKKSEGDLPLTLEGFSERAYKSYVVEGFIKKLFFKELFELSKRVKSPPDLTLMLFRPNLSTLNQGNISIFQTLEKSDRGINTSMKPGRAFRFMFPEATDRDVEIFVDAFRAEFPSQDLTLKEGREREDFKHMYSHNISSTENIRTTKTRKSLACSCMRHNFGKVHPSEAYASGEFIAMWTETERGDIASRVVAHEPSKTYGPIYGTTEYSVDLLQEHLSKLGYECGEDGSWFGANILLLPNGHGGYYFPYVDFGLVPDVDSGSKEGLCALTDDYDEMPTDGVWYPGERGIYCSCCGERYPEDDMHYDDNGDPYCECCWADNFIYSEYQDQYISNDYAIEVFVNNPWGAGVRKDVVSDTSDFVECYDGALYHESIVVELASGESAYEGDQDIFESDLTFEFHHRNFLEHTEDMMECATKEEFEAANYKYNEDKGFWYEQEEDDAEAA